MHNIYSVNKDIKQNIQCMNGLNFKLGQYYAEKDFDMIRETIDDIENQLIWLRRDINWIETKNGVKELG